MKALIDADTAAYAAASMAEGQDEQIAVWNTNAAVEKILAQWNISDFQLFVTGDNNFRYSIFPEYKAGRLKIPRPQWLEVCKQHLVKEWGAIQSDGCEADDLLGVEQTLYASQGIESVILSIDKDLDQIPGWHYSPEIVHKGVVVKQARRYVVSPNEALRFFYYQLLVGDSTDGIKGAPGIGKVKAEKILGEGYKTGREYYESVIDYFSCEEELDMNAQVLYIWRQMNDNWKRMMLCTD
jgi:DNA polymerase-1